MVGTWYVKTCHSIDDHDLVSLYLLRHRMLVCALQEAMWDGKTLADRHVTAGSGTVARGETVMVHESEVWDWPCRKDYGRQ